jgi:FtsX extracellular domain
MDERNELERLAGPLLVDPPIPRTPVADIRRRAARRTRQRMAAVGIAAAAVLLVAGTALAMTGRETTDVQVGTGPGTTLNPAYDLTVYLGATARPPEVAAIQARLLADPNVTGLLFSTQADSYLRFQCLFSHEPQFLESVQAADLPSTFAVNIVGGQTEMDRLGAWLAGDAAVKELGLPPGSPYQVSQPTTTLGPGEDPVTIPPGASQGSMQYATSTSIRDCPVTGTTLR